MDESDILKLKLTNLRSELQKYNLPSTGRKKELQERLLNYLNKQKQRKESKQEINDFEESGDENQKQTKKSNNDNDNNKQNHDDDDDDDDILKQIDKHLNQTQSFKTNQNNDSQSDNNNDDEKNDSLNQQTSFVLCQKTRTLSDFDITNKKHKMQKQKKTNKQTTHR